MNRNPIASNSVARMKCPNCGAKMHIRLASKGRSIGRYFWGCSTYPNCKETVTARPEDLPQREANAVGYVTCPQCAGSGTDMRTPLFRWLFTGATGLGPDLSWPFTTAAKVRDASLSTDIERLSLHKSCQLCLGTGLRLLPSVEAARKALTMEATLFEEAMERLRKNAQDSKTNDEEMRKSQKARQRLGSTKAEEDYLMLLDEKKRAHHLNELRRSFDDPAEGRAAVAAEEIRLNTLDNAEHRERLKDIVEKRKTELAIANQGYELGQNKEKLDSSMPGILAAVIESAYRSGSIRILLGIALEIVADTVERERVRTRPKVSDETAERVEDEPSELASEKDLALDEDYPLDAWDLTPSLDLLAPDDLDGEDYVETLFSHRSDEPGFGEQDESSDEGEEA